MTRYVVKHRELPVPILVDDATREVVNAAIRSKQSAVMVGTSTLPTFGLFVLSQRDFLENDHEELRRHGRTRCPWGRIHGAEESVRHGDVCRPGARRDSPFILPETWTRAVAVPADAGPAAEPASPEVVIRATERAIGNGHRAFRSLVRMYRRFPQYVSPRYKAACAAYDRAGIEDVPLTLPLDTPGSGDPDDANRGF